MSGGGSSTQTQRTEPWGPAQGPLQQVLQGYGTQYAQGGFAPEFGALSQQAQQAGIDRAQMGNPLLQTGQQAIQETARGDYLNANPYAQQMFEGISGNIADQVNSAFGGAGRVGSGLHAGTLAREIGQAGTNFYGNIYNQERGRQLAAAGMAPSMAQADWNDINQLASLGAQQDILAQAQSPLGQLQSYHAAIAPIGGMGSQTSTPYYQNRAAGALGGASLGAGIAPLVGGMTAPWALGGALLGGLL